MNVCIINVWGYTEILPQFFFSFQFEPIMPWRPSWRYLVT